MYANGRGVPEDDAEAVRWWRLAAEQGYAAAQNNLGDMYENGQGVPEDHVPAYMWYNLAAAQGSEIAQSNKDLLEQRMTREQIAEAQRLSREWLEAHPSSN
jgi:TPR repeat protein